MIMAINPGPAGLAAGPVVFACWRGVEGDQGLYFTQLKRNIQQLNGDGTIGASVVEWSSQTKIPHVGSSDPPAIAYFNGAIHLAWKGIEDDSNIYTLSA